MIAGLIILGIIVLLVIIFVSWWIYTMNWFRKAKVKVDESLSGIDVALNKRFDLITKLYDSTKGYIKHESETLSKITSLRGGKIDNLDLDSKSKLSSDLDSLNREINVVVEQYPNLKADQHFANLQQELQKMETEIANARKYYNAVCVKFNNLVEMFPSNILAGIFHKTKKTLYEIDDTAQRENVKVQF